MNFKSSVFKSVQMTIHPALAAEMLATSIGNRVLRPSHIAYLSGLLQRGEWKLTHQGVAFDWNGNLRDGHHRLTTIVQTGIPAQLSVTYGLDPEACKAMDQGVVRTVADIMSIDKRVSEPVRLATAFLLKQSKPSIAQIETVAATGLQETLTALIEHHGGCRRYFSTSPMKLAAAMTIMAQPKATGFVHGQYKALCQLDFDRMTPMSKAMVRQVDGGKATSSETREGLARGLRVFDPARAAVTKVQVGEADVEAAVVRLRDLLAPRCAVLFPISLAA